jgi:hypothetical protein
MPASSLFTITQLSGETACPFLNQADLWMVSFKVRRQMITVAKIPTLQKATPICPDMQPSLEINFFALTLVKAIPQALSKKMEDKSSRLHSYFH